MVYNNFSGKNKENLSLNFVWNTMVSATCSLKWVNELQDEILNQLIIHSTLGITFVAPLFTNWSNMSRAVNVLFIIIEGLEINLQELNFGDHIAIYKGNRYVGIT